MHCISESYVMILQYGTHCYYNDSDLLEVFFMHLWKKYNTVEAHLAEWLLRKTVKEMCLYFQLFNSESYD